MAIHVYVHVSYGYTCICARELWLYMYMCTLITNDCDDLFFSYYSWHGCEGR